MSTRRLPPSHHNNSRHRNNDNNQQNHAITPGQQRRMARCSHQVTVASILAVAVLSLVGGIRTTTTITSTQFYFDFSTLSNGVFGRSTTARRDGTYGDLGMQRVINGVVVTVGRRGPAIRRAIMHGMAQRKPGSSRDVWDVIETSKCIVAANDGSDKTTANINNSTYSRDEIRASGLPNAILLGAQKCGTTALYHFLDQHKDIAMTTKELYFLDEEVDEILFKRDKRHNKQNKRNDVDGDHATGKKGAAAGGGIPQRDVRQRYQTRIRSAMKYPKRDAGKMVLDLTPNYIFKSDRVPARISCILPWAKLMVLLRNPIERARSQFDMKVLFSNGTNPYGNRNPTFSEYVRNDLEALKEVGVIQDWSVVDFDAFFESDAMKEAWRAYVNSGLNAPIGMGLYAIQLKPFLELPNDFLAIRSEELKINPQATFSKVLDFLGLPPNTGDISKLLGFGNPIVFSKGINGIPVQKKSGIDKSTEALLREVFEPFNRKLAEMLGKDWEGVWDNEPVTRPRSKFARELISRILNSPNRTTQWRY